jgi:hypothetical protein
MTKTLAASCAALLACFAFAGAALAAGDSSGQMSTGAMASHDSMSSGAMTSDHAAMSTGAMASHDAMSASDHMAKPKTHKRNHHAAAAAMSKQS